MPSSWATLTNNDISTNHEYCESQFNDYGSVVNSLFSGYRDKELVKSEPVSILPVYVCLLAVHCFDWLFYQLTYVRWDIWKVIDSKQRQDLAKKPDNRLRNAMAAFFALYILRLILILYFYLSYMNSAYVCQPFLSVAVTQDCFVTVSVQLWVMIESYLSRSSH